MRPALIQLAGIHFAYRPHGTAHALPLQPVLTGLDLTLQEGEKLCLTGGNGCGKTTLLHLIVGLLTPTAGKVIAFGRERCHESDFHEVRKRVGLVFQYADDQLFCPRVIEDVAFGPLNLGKSPEEARAIAEKTLQRLGLWDFEDRITYKLSGGEKRLVSLAAVLAMEPEVLLLDEPSAGLDENASERLVQILNILPQAMLIVSHEQAFLKQVSHRALQLENGIVKPA
ncbi:MAG: ABC transporter ATP-binding protein [Planctomycetes bacterium]|nr:ABC transporter ATP-binding protein [Planctomycetota bacterium]